MKILGLRQSHFRNLKQQYIQFDPYVTLLIGNNGQGKTNILEAIYLLLNGVSFRHAKVEHFIQKNETIAFIEIEVLRKDLLKDKIKIQFSNKTKKVYLNNKSVSIAQIQKNFPTVQFCPESLSAVKEGPELRRALVDEWLIIHNAKNVELHSEYRKCLKVRNKLLKDFQNSKIQKIHFEDVFQSLNYKYIPLATKLTHSRVIALRDIAEDFEKCAANILDLPTTKISMNYIISGQNSLNWSEKEIYYALLKRQEELASSEKDSGTSLIGPHRHDIQFLFDQVDARYYCSQGQQRALILAFKMAQIMYHHRVHQSYPVLLLDDVLSELDPKRRDKLLAFLEQLKAQIILTTTDLEFKLSFEKNKLTVFHISQGEVTQNVE